MRIDDELLADAKAFAARRGRSLNSVMEDALRQLLNQATVTGERPYIELPVYGDPDSRPLIDVTPEALKQLQDEEDVERYAGGKA